MKLSSGCETTWHINLTGLFKNAYFFYMCEIINILTMFFVYRISCKAD